MRQEILLRRRLGTKSRLGTKKLRYRYIGKKLICAGKWRKIWI